MRTRRARATKDQHKENLVSGRRSTFEIWIRRWDFGRTQFQGARNRLSLLCLDANAECLSDGGVSTDGYRPRFVRFNHVAKASRLIRRRRSTAVQLQAGSRFNTLYTMTRHLFAIEVPSQVSYRVQLAYNLLWVAIDSPQVYNQLSQQFCWIV